MVRLDPTSQKGDESFHKVPNKIYNRGRQSMDSEIPTNVCDCT